MTPLEVSLARVRLRERVDSLANDVRQCFCACAGPAAPTVAYFPAVMYCFATLDYFASHRFGTAASKGQTQRMTSYLVDYFAYGQIESYLAVNIWRHKLMHTSEPRKVRDRDTGTVFGWRIDPGPCGHMALTPEGAVTMLTFNPLTFCEHLETAVFGPNGYFLRLEEGAELQANYCACRDELDGYEVDTSKAAQPPNQLR